MKEVLRIHGINSVMEALKTNRVKTLYIDDDRGRKAELIRLARELNVKIVKKKGVSADVVFKYSDFDELLTGELILYADNVEDPRNLGALIRTAVFFGCSGVAIPRRRAVRITDAVVKTSAGAVFHTKVAFANASCLKKAKKMGYTIIAADLDGTDIRMANLSTPAVLVVGGEDRGISRPVKNMCDEVIKIPGKFSSLNLSVAAGIIMYELSI